MAGNFLRVKDRKTANILRHPLRYTIIFIIADSVEPMTVQMIADKLNMKHGNVFYHVKKLVEVGALKLERTEEVNSFVTKYYGLAVDDIYFSKDSLQEVNKSYLAECNNLVARRAMNNYIYAVFPESISYDASDAINDVMKMKYYYFKPDDIWKIAGEVNKIFEKYATTPEEGVEYATIKGIGKCRVPARIIEE